MMTVFTVHTKPHITRVLYIDTVKDAINAEKAEIAGAGFINFTMPTSFWQGQLAVMLANYNNYGASQIGAGNKVNIEYVSANPTGPLHIGHARGAVFGDALAGLLTKAGYQVDKEYYINDAGGQVKILVESTLFRYNQLLGKAEGEVPDGCYPGEYLIEVAKALQAKHGDLSLIHI